MRILIVLCLFFSSIANADQLWNVDTGWRGNCPGVYSKEGLEACFKGANTSRIKYKSHNWSVGSGTVRHDYWSDHYQRWIKNDQLTIRPVGSCPAGTELINGECKETNYCDSMQYQIDYDAAKNACESQTTEFQTATFSGQCNREAERLESSCDLVGVTPPKPEPDLCPDGSQPNADGSCGDTGGGGDGGGSGGGGDGGDGGGSGGGTDGDGSGDIDLSGLLDAINNNNKSITGAITDSRPAVNDLLNVQTKALSTSVESNRLLGVGIAALDVSNDALSNIANLTRDLNNKTANEVSQSLESNRLLGQGVAALDVSNDALSNIADLTQGLNNTVTTKSDRIADEIIKNTDELKLQTAQQEQITESQLASNDLLTGINASTDKTNELLADIDKSISSSSSITSNELSEMLGSLSKDNKNNNDDIIKKLDELERNANKHDLTYGNLTAMANSADSLVDANLEEYQNFIEGKIATALNETPMTEALFDKVKEFANELIPISSTCQNLSFGDYFTVECSKFQKFRDIFGFFIYVYTALTLIDILFTGIVPNPARKPY
ncbi:hypothetical protein UB40_05040 [Photobacterium kishitanii]|uniref:hypothetical protein n=1 Tax=Photobacterium kishitanii TaxID=318456 RepID=UPI0005D2EFF4|nr:hypothetical protein [Photobacterium kishitanii]KJG10724.1 hypothetical protein UB40_05040 [Photobacterium kishitanii]